MFGELNMFYPNEITPNTDILTDIRYDNSNPSKSVLEFCVNPVNRISKPLSPPLSTIHIYIDIGNIIYLFIHIVYANINLLFIYCIL